MSPKRFLQSLKLEEPSPEWQLPFAEFINAESAYGRTLFGPIPAGRQREFFAESKNIWVWYESWLDCGEIKSVTIRYEVRPDGVFKKPIGKDYTRLEGAELDNFCQATKYYLQLVKKHLYTK